jgi:hypothetical protein
MNANIHNERVVNISLSKKICCNIQPLEKCTHKQTETHAALNTFVPAFIEIKFLLPEYIHSNMIFIVDNYNSLILTVNRRQVPSQSQINPHHKGRACNENTTNND